MIKEVIINEIEETKALAEAISSHVFPGFLLCLEGDLGAGKTTFTKFFGKKLGIEDVINSPTFTILKVYEADIPLYHMDAYRLHGIGMDYDLEEFIYGEGICVIEWYSNIIDSLPKEKLEIEIVLLGDGKRKFTLKGCGVYGEIIKKIGN
jgi:tRNA threonylcarbamoyladenosine biosynthesis protein TsaE